MSIFAGKTLMITGGTGSFGNAVLNRFLRTDIGEIRIFSRDEKKQDDMRHEYQAKFPEVAHKIKFYIGDALRLIPALGITFDLAFVDGDKRKYIEYYEMTLAHLSVGGYIIADNTLWDGHVLEEPHSNDHQTIGIKAFNELVAHDERVEKVILPLRDGLTIIRKK